MTEHYRLAAHYWAMRPDVIRALMSWDAPVEISAADVEAATRRSAPRSAGQGAMVIPLKGVITPHASLFSLLFGGADGSLDTFRRSFRNAMGDSEVGTVVLDVDSPGGLVDLVPETAAEIRKARESKKIVAVSNPLTASAAYWLASQADEIVVTPSGESGSIGVYATHQDISGALDKAGIKPTLISAGKYKVEGNPYEPLDEEAQQAIQDSVDEYYGMFVKDVAAGRGVKVSEVKAGYGEGRTLTAGKALEANLVDRVDTLESTVARLTGRRESESSGSQAEDLDGSLVYSSEERSRLLDTLARLGLPIEKEEASA